MEPLVVNVREAGRLLAVSPYTIRRMLRDGRLVPVRCGRRLLVDLEALKVYVAENRDYSTKPLTNA